MLLEWAMDDIAFYTHPRNSQPTKFSHWEFRNMARAIATKRGEELINPGTRLMAVEILDMSAVDVIHAKAKELGVDLTTQYILKFERLQELQFHLLHRAVVKNSWEKE